MKTLLLTTAVIATAFSGAALADSRHGNYDDRGYTNRYDRGPSNTDFRDYAQVVNVEPIYRTVTTSRPSRECSTEEVYRPVNDGPRRDPALGMIIGGVIGGALGHNVGDHNRDASRIAGAVIGSAVGHQVASNNRGRNDEYERDYVERCRTVNVRDREERIDGYRVTYRYHGQTFTTRMDQDPGRRMPVQVAVSPLR